MARLQDMTPQIGAERSARLKKDGWFFPDQARVQRRIKDLADHYKSSNAYGWTRDLAKEMAKMSQPGKPGTVKQEREDTLEQEEIEEPQLDSL
jgi:hypothetical protein